MAIRYLRQSPQTYGLTGRWRRMPITQETVDILPTRRRLARISPDISGASLGGDIAPDVSDFGFGVDPGQATGATGEPAVGLDAIGEALGQDIGQSAALGFGSRGVKGIASTSVMGALANAPVSNIAKSAISNAVTKGFSPTALVGLFGNLGISSESAADIIGALSESGLIGTSTPTSSPMFGVSKNIARSALINAPRSIPQKLFSIFGFSAPASEVAAETVSAAEEGLSSVTGIPGLSAKGAPKGYVAEDPVTAALFGKNPQVLANMVDLSMQAEPTGTGTPDVSPTGVAGNLGMVSTESMMGEVFGGSEVGSDSYGGYGGASPGGSEGPPGTPGEAGLGAGPGADGAGDGTVLCTELYRQGIMPEHIYRKDQQYGRQQDTEVLHGYHLWAIPLAHLMSKSKIVTGIMKYPVMAWAKHIAGERNWFGGIVGTVGVSVCRWIGYQACKIKAVKANTNKSTMDKIIKIIISRGKILFN